MARHMVCSLVCPWCRLVTLLMDHKETQSPAQQRRQLQIAELIRNTWGFGKDFSVNEVKHVLGILSVNSFVVHDGAEDGLDLIGKLSLLGCLEFGQKWRQYLTIPLPGQVCTRGPASSRTAACPT